MTTSLKTVTLSRITLFCQVLSLLGALTISLNFAWWSVASSNFGRGFRLGEAPATYNIQHDRNFSLSPVDSLGYVSGGDIYTTLSSEYAKASLFALSLMISLGFSFLAFHRHLKYMLSAVNLLLLVVMCWKLSCLLSIKDPVENESLGSPFYLLVRESAIYDYVALGIASSLIFIQVVRTALLLRFDKTNGTE